MIVAGAAVTGAVINAAWVRSAARERLGVEAHELPGGHSPFLGRPIEMVDLLEALA